MVNFSPSEEQELLRQTLASFSRDVLRPRLRESDEKDVVPAEIPPKAWELGLVQESLPEEFGGFGGTRSAVSGVLAIEELAYGGLALGLHVVAPRLVTVPLLAFGSDEQKKQWLPKFAGAEFVAGTAALTEPRWDFDPADPVTTAERAGGDWVLSGDQVLRAAGRGRRRDARVRQRHREGLGAFLVERGRQGRHHRRAREEHGPQGARHLRVTLEGVHVPASARLGGDASISRRCSTRCAWPARRWPSAWRAPRSTTRATTPRSARRSGGDRAEAGDRLHARRDGDRDRRHAPARLGGGVEDRPRRGRPRARRAWRSTMPPTRCSRSPTTRCRCSAATATSATIWSSCCCATPAASPSSKAWRSSES